MKKNKSLILGILCCLLLGSSLSTHAQSVRFEVRNRLKIDRQSETIQIPMNHLSSLLKTNSIESLVVRPTGTGMDLITQGLDIDGDGAYDALIFQTDIKASEKKVFEVVPSSNPKPFPQIRTYGRFVPERIDDFAWENDRVAFRTYGPEAQRITESGAPGGTLSSGMDCWLKSVSYPIIDKWYQKNVERPGAYHVLTEEGYDPYHVGGSRGCGGIGVLVGDSLFTSKNFISYKVLANGPIRTVFELTYAPWEVNGIRIEEKKRISIDLGSNLTRYEAMLNSSAPLPNVTIGITLHDKKGQTRSEYKAGWFRYWEPMDGSEMGEGMVVPEQFLTGYEERRVEVADQSQLFAITTPVAGKVVYYAGFGWKKSGQFKNTQEWDAYLSTFAQGLKSPLQVRFL